MTQQARPKKKTIPPVTRTPRTPYPTTAQLECLRVFGRMRDQLGRAPTIREVSAEMGLSEMGARGHFAQLEQKGYMAIETEPVVKDRWLTAMGEKWRKMPG
jgi:hypothetical protein